MPIHANTESADALDEVHRMGLSVGESAWTIEGRRVWRVNGRKGRRPIRVEAASAACNGPVT